MRLLTCKFIDFISPQDIHFDWLGPKTWWTRQPSWPDFGRAHVWKCRGALSRQKAWKRSFLSFPWKRESRKIKNFWTPAPRLRGDRLRGSDDYGYSLRDRQLRAWSIEHGVLSLFAPCSTLYALCSQLYALCSSLCADIKAVFLMTSRAPLTPPSPPTWGRGEGWGGSIASN